ncbi:hypothetical protein GOODEAATRI_034123 [Goodea atripinnis]|uniref:Uncharacterized protein n=1 Tax=Goodea atripinnis TaxID=208336 RepID=A0ABV0PUN6_9TELE
MQPSPSVKLEKTQWTGFDSKTTSYLHTKMWKKMILAISPCYFILTFPSSGAGSNPCDNPAKGLNKNVLVTKITLHRTKEINSDITMCLYEFNENNINKIQMFLTVTQFH